MSEGSPALEALADAVRPRPRLTVAEWSDENVFLGESDAHPGPYRTRKTPYVREPGDCLSSGSPYHTVVIEKGAQTGFSLLAANWLGYCIDQDPAPSLYVGPDQKVTERFSRQRLQPMIDECEALRRAVTSPRSRDGGSTLHQKDYTGGPLVLTWATSAVGLRQMAARNIVFDDVDGYPPDVGGEGDPIQLAAARQRAGFFASRKSLLISTPTIAGLSRIAAAYQRTDQRRYFVACPKCDHRAPISWARIEWPDDDVERAFLRCHECGEAIPERLKTQLLAGGIWQATADSVDPGLVGFHLSELYSPLGWVSWAQIARDFQEARKNREQLKVWTNTALGETFEEEGLRADAGAVSDACEDYAAEVPGEVLVVTAAVDVQDDRLEVEVQGAAASEEGEEPETWGIELRIFPGDPRNRPVWDQLERFLNSTWTHESGHQLGISATGVDTGHLADECYAFVKRAGARRIVYALKGKGGPGIPLVGIRAKAKRGRKQPVPVYTVGTDTAKDRVYDGLRMEEPGPGYHHFPNGRGYDGEYFAQLTSEERVIRFKRGFPYRCWILPPGRANEGLDLKCYNLATLAILNVSWSEQRKLLGRPVRKTEKRPARRPGRRRRRNWVTDI